MKTIPKILTIAGIVAGLGTVGLPLFSYAAEDEDTASVTVNLGVTDIISITASANSINLGELAPNQKTGTGNSIILNIKSNNYTGYQLTAHGNPLTVSGGQNSAFIPYGSVQDGSSAYGISKSDGEYGAFETLGGKGSPSANDGDNYPIYFAASTSATQTTGTYTGTVIFTATNLTAN